MSLNPISKECAVKIAASDDNRSKPVLTYGMYLHRSNCELSHSRSSASNKARDCRIQPRLAVPPLMPDMGVEAHGLTTGLSAVAESTTQQALRLFSAALSRGNSDGTAEQ
jgi:hypothetical protein